MINGSGLSGTPTTENIQTITHNTTGSTGNATIANNVPTVSYTFNLGSLQTVQQIYIWNLSQPNNNNFGRAVKDFTLETSATSGGTFLPAGSFTLTRPTENPWRVEAFSLTGNKTGVQFVRLNVLNNYQNGNDPGLGEVRFDNVPEPGTFATLLGGAGLLGMLRRRSRVA
jgi:hypothetical protein